MHTWNKVGNHSSKQKSRGAWGGLQMRVRSSRAAGPEDVEGMGTKEV